VKNFKIIITGLLLLIFVSGCSKTYTTTWNNLTYIPPNISNYENKKDFHASYDQVWEGVISYFAENNISIETLEKDSGIVVAKKMIANSNAVKEMFDTGYMKSETCSVENTYENPTFVGIINPTYVTRHWRHVSSDETIISESQNPVNCRLNVKFNVFVRKSIKKVTVIFNLNIETVDADNSNIVAVSNGIFERSFFDYIGRYINQNS